MTAADRTGGPPKATRASRVTAELRAAVLRGELAPGAKVNLDALRDRLGVSLSPLREAVSRLATEGLLDFEDQRGYRVAPLSDANLREVTMLRADLATKALEETIRRADIEWEGRVLAALHSLGQVSPDTAPDAWEAAHRAFHAALTGGAEMPLLGRFLDVVETLAERYRRAGRRAGLRLRDSQGEHAVIAEAAVSRDKHSASRLLRAHVQKSGEELVALFRQDNGSQ